MGQEERKNIIKFVVMIVAVFSLLFGSGDPVNAMEDGTEGVGSVILPTVSDEIVSVVLPTVGDVSPFDFIIDPESLIYETDAAKYGGGSVEEGAHLLFHNYAGDGYDFSCYSDELTVVNKSTVPVVVRITAKIEDFGDITLDQDGDFDDENNPAIYLALVDNEGNIRPLSEDGEVVIEIEMQKAPSGAYSYRYNADQDTYEYVSADDGEIEFDTYSFGLYGDCNANADWKGVNVSPRVTVIWEVDPVMPEKEDENEDADDEETEESVEEDSWEASNENLTDETMTYEDDNEENTEVSESLDENGTDITDDSGVDSEPDLEDDFKTENRESYENQEKEDLNPGDTEASSSTTEVTIVND